MQALQIPSHSRRITSLAVAGLAVLAAAAFSFGLERQVRRADGTAAFPVARASGLGGYVDNIPDATPARPIEVAIDTRVRRRAPTAEILDTPDQVAPSADAAPAVDASATAPATTPPPPKAQPDNDEPPT